MYWDQYVQGKLIKQELMQILGDKNVCFVAPERMDIVMTITAKLQGALMSSINNPYTTLMMLMTVW